MEMGRNRMACEESAALECVVLGFVEAGASPVRRCRR